MKSLTCLVLGGLASFLSVVQAVEPDLVPPTVVTVTPAPLAVVPVLRQIEVAFSEPVAGVDAADLRINSLPATNVFAAAPGQYVFEFSQPGAGTVTVTWAEDHGITDLAVPPNGFAGGSWTLVLETNPPVTGVILNEFMAANSAGLRDEDGDTSDWIELRNLNSVPVDLAGWFLTDDAGDLAKWRFPSVTLDPNGYLVVFASGKNRATNVNRLHTNFQLASGGEFLALVSASTNVVSSFAPAFPPQLANVSYGRDRLSPELTGTMATPTPGLPNSDAGPGFAPEVVFSVEGGTFVQPFELQLSTTDPAAEIRYTVVTGGAAGLTNVPGPQSLLYAGPIPIGVTTQIRARAFRAGYLPGAPRTETFIQLQSGAASFSSDLPIVLLHNLGQGPVPAAGDQAAYIAVFDRDAATGRATLSDRPSVNGRIGLNVRGRGSQGYAKSGFAVEFWDEYGQDKDREVLGLPAESDWVLYGTLNTDAVLIHNPLAREMSNILGRKASRTRFVEVFLNTAGGPVRYVNPTNGNYNGIYVLIEKIKQGADRVDVAPLQAEDTGPDVVSGGYIFKSDDPPEADEVFFTGARQQIIMVYPGKRSLASPQRAAQFDYVRNYFAGFSNALFGVNWTNPVSGYAPYIDVDSWIDHAMVSITTFNVDAIRLSGYFYKDRGKPLEMGPVWDADRSLGAPDSRQINPRFWRGQGGDGGTDYFNPPGPGPAHYWFPQLFRDIDFWQRYIDRYQTVREGPYSLTNLYAIIDRMLGEVAEAQPREAARWGAIAPYRGTNGTGAGTFATEVTWLKTWLANRLNFMDTNFLDLPVIGSFGGLVTAGTQVPIVPAAEEGSSVLYTLDGTDPRWPNGIISPTAFSNNGPVTVTIQDNARIVARSYNPAHRNLNGPNNPPLNSIWSGPRSLTLYTHTPALRITEIMYHPAAAPAGDTNDVDNFEFIEVRNTGGTPLNVNRFRLRGGVDFDFPEATLAAGEYAVIVHHAAAFASRYGPAPRILGVYSSDRLGDNSDHLILEGPVQEPILDFTYRDQWYPVTDGLGFSLQIVNDSAPPASWGVRESWRPSGVNLGTPGTNDPGAPLLPTVYINEVSPHNDPLPADAIELFNPGSSPADIGNWYLSDGFNNSRKYRIPAGTTLPANGYLVFYESNSFGVGANAFGLGSKGDSIYLFSGNAAGDLTGYLHGFDFGAQASGATFGRVVVSTGEDQFFTQSSPTLGAANNGPKIGPIVITEINYDPPVDRGGRGLSSAADEYIELYNSGTTPVPLYDTLYPENTWRLRDAVDFVFPRGVILPPAGFVLVVSFTPTNGPGLSAFRAANGVPDGVPIYGPWSGQLDNISDNVELTRPDLPDPPGTPSAGFVPHILVDKVGYQNAAPWPGGPANGLGASLSRKAPALYGNDPANWTADFKNPGALPAPVVAEPAIVVQPQDQVGDESYRVTFTIQATGQPLGYQWLFEGNALRGGVSPTLTLNNLRLDQAGNYSCIVYNGAGNIRSRSAHLTVRPLPVIQLQPAEVRLRGSTNAVDYGFTTNNATFTVSATGTGTLNYQWRFNGVDLPGANASTLVVNNVGLTNDGVYDVAIRDDVAPVTSLPARLVVLLTPTFLTTPPATVLVNSNGTFNASVSIRGNPPPFRYEWREISAPRFTNTSSDTNAYIAYGPITNLAPRSWRMIVFNDAATIGVAYPFLVQATPDTDGDGIPDDWETRYGLNPASGADRNLDSDGDGVSNYLEYLAGTDPTDRQSNLRLDLITSPGAAVLRVGALSNHTYSVQYSDSLPGGWKRLTDLLALPADRVVSITDPTYTTNRFYRLVHPRQP